MDSKEKSIHTGHRKRVKNRFLHHGLDGFEPHVVLELFLFYAIPQGDTNPTAHRLLNQFGTIDKVFDAPYEELLQVKGIGESAATLIKMMPALFRVYSTEQAIERGRAYEPREMAKLLQPRFIGMSNEAVVIMLLDSKGVVLHCSTINEGAVNTAPVYVRRIVTLANRYNAAAAVLAHNHPTGDALPSRGDIAATREVMWALEGINVTLSDHIIIAGNNYTSLAQAGWLPNLEVDMKIKKTKILQAPIFEEETPLQLVKKDIAARLGLSHGTYVGSKEPVAEKEADLLKKEVED